MKEPTTPLSSDEKILWEGTPSKAKCQKISRLSLLLTSLTLAITALITILVVYFLMPGSLWLIIPLSIVLFIFIGAVFIWMFSKIEGSKWKMERYRITNKRIIKDVTVSIFASKTQATNDINLDDLIQFKVFQSVGDRFFNMDTCQIWFFIEHSTFPKIYFSHVEDPEKIKSVLDSLMVIKRRRELEGKNQNPYSSIEWFQEKNKKPLFIDVLIKIGIMQLITIGPYFLFRWMFSIITPIPFGIVDIIVLYCILIPLDCIFSLFFLFKLIKNVTNEYYVNNFGVYQENKSEPLLELNEISQFLIKQPIFFRLLNIEAPTFIFFKELSGKAILKIPVVKNVQLLRDQLVDVLYLRKRTGWAYETTLEKGMKSFEDTPRDAPLTIESADIDLSQPNYKYLYSYLSPDEKVIRICNPNLSSSRKNFLLTTLPIMAVACVFLFLFLVIPYIPMEIPLLVAILILPMILCTVISVIYSYFKLKRTEYVITNEKLIIKTDKKIDFLPFNQIESISINKRFSDQIFKLNTGNIHILMKKSPSSRFSMLPNVKFKFLQSLDNPQEIYDLIMRLKSEHSSITKLI